MNILVIGSGGREHALCWKIKQSPKVKRLYCAPGNAGIASVAECVSIKVEDIEGLLSFALEKRIDLTIVGPEIPLVAGIVDLFTQKGLKIFGPSKTAAQLEGSKSFSKDFMKRWQIPTAEYKVFDIAQDAIDFINFNNRPLVIKADGLAAGKGVYICQTKMQAEEAIKDIMIDKIFGEAGSRVVIEECLDGPEVSVLAIADGKHFLILPTAQDHKRIFDDDLGPNTGGMGTLSPNPLVNGPLLNSIIKSSIEPAIRGMYHEGSPFKGVLYAGIMLTEKGPQVLEYNVRFGDPETQCIIPRLHSDIVDILTSACDGRLNELTVKWDYRPCVCVVMASGGYPGKYQNGFEIKDLPVNDDEHMVFHAGTKNEGGVTVTNGGRVLGVCAIGDNLEKTLQKAYEMVDTISFERAFFRRDIGQQALRLMKVEAS